MDRTSRTIPALVLGAGLTLGAGLAFTSCGDDDDDDNVPATEPGGTESMVDTTEAMTDTTEMMTDTPAAEPNLSFGIGAGVSIPNDRTERGA